MSSRSQTAIVVGEVQRDIRALANAIGAMPHFRVTSVEQGVIHAERERHKQWAPTAKIRVEIEQADQKRMRVTITGRMYGIWDTFGILKNYVSQVVGAIQKVQAPWSRPKRPFGPSTVD